jgi:hypothetical protein
MPRLLRLSRSLGSLTRAAGRTQYGEDPWLTAMLGEQYVSGLQFGPASSKYLKVLAGCKHFDVHTGPENSNCEESGRARLHAWNRSMLTEIHLCHACFYHEM